MPHGFKEWSVVCRALGEGKQSIILRKGGISEDPAGFAFKHPFFYLLPTQFHQQYEKVTLPAPTQAEKASQGVWPVGFAAEIVFSAVLRDWDKVKALASFHIWKEEVVRERFDYDQAGCIHLAVVRVFKLSPDWQIPDSPEFAGCKSWVELPGHPVATSLEAPLPGDELASRLSSIKSIVG